MCMRFYLQLAEMLLYNPEETDKVKRSLTAFVTGSSVYCGKRKKMHIATVVCFDG